MFKIGDKVRFNENNKYYALDDGLDPYKTYEVIEVRPSHDPSYKLIKLRGIIYGYYAYRFDLVEQGNPIEEKIKYLRKRYEERHSRMGTLT